MAKEPIRYILDNIDAIYKAYIENDRKPKATYEGLKAGVISDIETHIEFKTFNSRIKPIMETYEFLRSDKPESDESENENLKNRLDTMRQSRQETLSELDQVQKENDRLKSDIQRYIEKDIQRDKQLKTLQSELDKQMKIEDIQDIQKEDIQDIQKGDIQDIQKEDIQDIQKEDIQDIQKEDIQDIQIGDIQIDVIRTLIEDVENLKKEVAILRTKKDIQKDIQDIQKDIQDIQKDISKDIQPKKESLKLGKWSIVLQNGYYKAVRNFGVKEDGKKDIQNIYIGKIYNEQLATEKITAKGYPID
jgi:hypothetical protein